MYLLLVYQRIMHKWNNSSFHTCAFGLRF